MSPSAKLTNEEKQNGKRKLLIPSNELQEMMQPVTRESFARLVKKAIPPSPQPETAKS
jgi:ribosomal protein L19E